MFICDVETSMFMRVHHDMARLLVADGEDSLHMLWVAVNVLNKQSRTVGGGPPTWELGAGLTTPRRKTGTCCEILHRNLELNGFFGATWATENG